MQGGDGFAAGQQKDEALDDDVLRRELRPRLRVYGVDHVAEHVFALLLGRVLVALHGGADRDFLHARHVVLRASHEPRAVVEPLAYPRLKEERDLVDQPIPQECVLNGLGNKAEIGGLQ